MSKKGKHIREPKHAKPETKLQMAASFLLLVLKFVWWIVLVGIPTAGFYIQFFSDLVQL